jgi:hypothetical protein
MVETSLEISLYKLLLLLVTNGKIVEDFAVKMYLMGEKLVML